MKPSVIFFPLNHNYHCSVFYDLFIIIQALIAKQAAERLTERLNVKMGDFIPQIQGR